LGAVSVVCGRGVTLVVVFFFFQAEDGIRDWSVTGVQTCALPICVGGVVVERIEGVDDDDPPAALGGGQVQEAGDLAHLVDRDLRSEERRVGKEWRSRGGPYD